MGQTVFAPKERYVYNFQPPFDYGSVRSRMSGQPHGAPTERVAQNR